MNKTLTILTFLISLNLCSQNKIEYLEQNRFDMENPDFVFPETDFNIIGFGAYHGSAKTYDAEFQLIKSLKEQNALDYYVPETNFSQAFFFQQYLETGDEELLKELVSVHYTYVPQDASVETFNHWKKLRELNQKYEENPIKVIGFDVTSGIYKFPIKHILLLTENIQNWKANDELKKYVPFSIAEFDENYDEIEQALKNFINDYETNKTLYADKIKDIFVFEHILKNIAYNFPEKRDREKIIFDNYVYLKNHYQLDTKKQFVKYGFFHIEKEREGNYPSFFTRLIEQNVYAKNKIITVMGYLTKSEVLWAKIRDKQGNYKTFITKKGYGIGDYWKERFKGIKNLKKAKLSDITLFKLNSENSPYKNSADLIEINLFLKKDNPKLPKEKNTT
ncbi:MAG: hypothetical protein LBE36_14210, partial [Flavobacteriaceae bacterium]|nr:hypothetical protein [Flavobacteriaceae bacterium]